MERALQVQMMKFLESTKQLNNSNNAYHKGYSTATALMQIMDRINEAADLKSIANIMTVDESTAFNCISHKILDKKLSLYNFGTDTRKWFSDYLHCRSQYVSIGSERSAMTQVKHGIPQGSVIKPILYSLYIHELPGIIRDEACNDDLHRQNPEMFFPPNCHSCPQIPSFADDTMVISTSKSRTTNQENLTEHLKSIKTFLNSNNLTMNESKTNLVEIMVPKKRVKLKREPSHLDTIDPEGNVKRVLGYNLQDNISQHLFGEIRQKLGGIKTPG